MSGTALETAYRLLARGTRSLVPLLAPVLAKSDSKLARGIRGRRGAAARLAAWGREARDPTRPLVWFHAPSVGEGLQARAVLEALRERRPDVQTLFTHFSPSALALAEAMPADAADYLPWDVPRELRAVLDAVRPSLVAFTKTEVWPVLVGEARLRGAGSVLVAGTLPEGSSRLRWPARAVLSPTFGRLTEVMAIAEGDAERFRDLGVPDARVVVTGDPGIDSAARRAAGADGAAPYLRPFREERRPTVVAGSTWPPDHAVLLPALARVREDVPDVRLVVAPHEPDEGHLRSLEEALGREGWTVRRLGAVEETGEVGGADAVVVDRVGVLAHLYTIGDVAYVGGGFHDDGLHSVLEPAAAGVPVTFGPRHRNARAAGEIAAAGGGRVVGDAGALGGALAGWLSDESSRRASGGAARHYIDGHLGAARRTADRLADLLA